MITYLYWALVLMIAAVIGWLIGRLFRVKAGVVSALIVLFIGWAAYYFEYEQYFVKNYGGVMSVEVPEGQVHISATWKDDHLWIENYDPRTNICHFNEYSKGHLLQGQVSIKNCNPLIPAKL